MMTSRTTLLTSQKEGRVRFTRGERQSGTSASVEDEAIDDLDGITIEL